jgi:TrmH family RNA methyltransferase
VSAPDLRGLRHPGVRALRALARDAAARADARSCVLEGPRVITAALDRGAVLTDAYFGHGARGAFPELAARLAGAGVAAHDLREGVLEKVGTTRTPQPVLAVARWDAAPLPVVVDGAVEGFAVLAVDIADPGNLGTILRSAEAAGAAGVVVAGESVDVRNPKVVRASAGALFGVPVAVVEEATAAAAALRRRHVRCYGAVPAGGRAPSAVPLARGAVIVLGNEARGLDDALLAGLDGTVTIPMAGAAESLNVAMAATVLCFEAARQRAAALDGRSWAARREPGGSR